MKTVIAGTVAAGTVSLLVGYMTVVAPRESTPISTVLADAQEPQRNFEGQLRDDTVIPTPVPASGLTLADSEVSKDADAQNYIDSTLETRFIEMDPNDPYTWYTGVEMPPKSVGRDLDGNDPETWRDPSGGPPVSVGIDMDANDPTTWGIDNADAPVVSVGEYLNPEDPTSWPYDRSAPVISVGADMDPDDPATW